MRRSKSAGSFLQPDVLEAAVAHTLALAAEEEGLVGPVAQPVAPPAVHSVGGVMTNDAQHPQPQPAYQNPTNRTRNAGDTVVLNVEDAATGMLRFFSVFFECARNCPARPIGTFLPYLHTLPCFPIRENYLYRFTVNLLYFARNYLNAVLVVGIISCFAYPLFALCVAASVLLHRVRVEDEPSACAGAAVESHQGGGWTPARSGAAASASAGSAERVPSTLPTIAPSWRSALVAAQVAALAISIHAYGVVPGFVISSFTTMGICVHAFLTPYTDTSSAFHDGIALAAMRKRRHNRRVQLMRQRLAQGGSGGYAPSEHARSMSSDVGGSGRRRSAVVPENSLNGVEPRAPPAPMDADAMGCRSSSGTLEGHARLQSPHIRSAVSRVDLEEMFAHHEADGVDETGGASVSPKRRRVTLGASTATAPSNVFTASTSSRSTPGMGPARAAAAAAMEDALMLDDYHALGDHRHARSQSLGEQYGIDRQEEDEDNEESQDDEFDQDDALVVLSKMDDAGPRTPVVRWVDPPLPPHSPTAGSPASPASPIQQDENRV
jgi:hypothetical protein